MKSKDFHLNNKCLVCYGKKIHYNFSLDKHRIEECKSCGLMRLNPQPSDEELLTIYNSNYFIALKNDNGTSHTAQLKAGTADEYLKLLESYVGSNLSGSLL